MMFKQILYSLLLLPAVALADHNFELQQAPIDPTNHASLQRGANIVMHYCTGCHSLQYMRYDRMAKDIGITDEHGDVLTKILKDNLMFNTKRTQDSIMSSMPKELSKKWFGAPPPDLSLETRSRGPDWVYTYLLSFYKDDSRPWGVNNLVFKDVGMPHALISLQGIQVPVYEDINYGGVTKKHIAGLKLESQGVLTPEQYQQMVGDVVNFLAYVADPVKTKREHIGIFVLLFLIVFTMFAYMLKREYWKDVH